MDFYAVSIKELEMLANQEKALKPHFAGVFAADTLPKQPIKARPQAYIVNTDPKHKEGQHWIGLWTENGMCQIMDSYGLPLVIYKSSPLESWLAKWPTLESNSISLQAINSATCGHYALKYLLEKSQGKTMRQFLEQFHPLDYVYNDARIARWLKHKMKRNST